jgi:photosystem II stability/assembly factor-like uncharacterized protein
MKNVVLIVLYVIIGHNSILSQNLWEKIKSPTTKNLQKLIFVDSLNGWAVGDSGIIVHTSDGGSSWSIQNSGIDLDIRSASFPDTNRGWALAWTIAPPYGTIILKTQDGGLSWKNEFYNGNDVFLNSIYFSDSLNGWIGGNYTGILYTTDGGKGWNQSQIDSFSGFPIYDFVFSNKNNGFASAGRTDIMGVIYKTTDGGKSWKGKSVSADPIQKLFYKDSIFIVGVGGDLEFGAGFISSRDGGANWVYKTLNFYGAAIGLSFRNPSEGWASVKGGFFGRFLVTNDTGNTWKEYAPPDSAFISDVTFTDSSHGYAVGLNGIILKYKSNSTSIWDKVESPFGYSLNQNYPNPFNPSTTISFSIAKREYVIIKIYNLLGEELRSFEYLMEKGGHEIKFTSGNLSSGTYIYTISAGEYRASKKMMILK